MVCKYFSSCYISRIDNHGDKTLEVKNILMKTEKFTFGLFLLAMAFKFMNWPGSGILLLGSTFTTSLLYCFFSFYFFSEGGIKNQNLGLTIISGVFLAFVPIGLLLKLLYWSGDQMYLAIGAGLTLITLLINLILKGKREELQTYYRRMIIRSSVLFTLALLFFIVPRTTLIKIQYSNEPELAKLKVLYYSNPQNEEYKRQHDDYLRKRDSIIQ